MRPTWATRYLTIPFCEKGRDEAGVDCYGLVRLIYQRERGITLPSYTEDYTTTDDVREIRRLLAGEVGTQWQEISLATVALFDGLVFRIMGQPIHFGMVLEAPWFIHAAKVDKRQTGKVWIERWDSIVWEKRLIGAVRWQQS